MALVSEFDDDTARFLQAWLRVRQVVQAANFNRFQRAGLSATQFMTLNVIPEAGLTLAELARKLNLSAASLKKTIDSLAERGLVVRRPQQHDARKINIVSTAKGRKLQNEASGEFHAFVASLFSSMTQRERQGLITGLERLAELSARGQAAAAAATPSRDGAAPAEHSTRRYRRQ